MGRCPCLMPRMQEEAGAEKEDESDEEETAEQRLSKRKRKEANRLKIAELKQTCPRPEVVEVWGRHRAGPQAPRLPQGALKACFSAGFQDERCLLYVRTAASLMASR